MLRRAALILLTALVGIGCGTKAVPANVPATTPASSAASVTATPPTNTKQDTPAASIAGLVQSTYSERVVRYPDLTWEGMIEQARVRRQPPAKLDFDPTRVDYYPEVKNALTLTPEEQALFKKNGFVVVDHGRHYSMGSAYHAIYTRDLPVLVTTDSILHAFHRSFDAILRSLEEDLLLPGFTQAFDAMHQKLGLLAAETRDTNLLLALGDVDVYLSVALNLLAGAGAPAGASGAAAAEPSISSDAAWDGALLKSSRTGKDAEVLELLKRVQAQRLELPAAGGCPNGTLLRGSRRCIDYTQFIPRGHYTKSPLLKRYFHAMMWLGRADTGWVIAGGTGANLSDTSPVRESRGAALLTLLIRDAGQTENLASLSHIIDLLVGVADSATPAHMADALKRAKVESVNDLQSDAAVLAAADALSRMGAAEQTIRSQTVLPAADGEAATKPPCILQLAGQRFVIDAFVLSKVVFDSIDYQGKRQERMLPMGLDVIAALGNDEAVHLLEPELRRYNYAANLLALRETLATHGALLFTENLYGSWLGTLQTLHPVPSTGNFPQSMRSELWQKKQLHTALASWAELRHDTVLYAKQSYSASTLCEYPDGYVEPYPEFFAKLGSVSSSLGKRLAAALPPAAKTDKAPQRVTPGQGERLFLDKFAKTMSQLGSLAKKELSSAPFTAEERAFIKKTIDVRGGGSGPPRYDGWYPELFFDRAPQKWEPTVADVHTSPGPYQPGVLEEAVGETNFIAIAIDNGQDRRVYVGPVYSYYEFVLPAAERLTDENWQRMLESGTPVARPKWTQGFIGKRTVRAMGPAARRENAPASVAL